MQGQVTPPLRGPVVLSETRIPFKRIVSAERVLVGIDAVGTPVSVEVVQRLTVKGLGDYTFAVIGPAADVVAAPGSDSQPGLRQGAILWSGFSAGQKTLAARATLRLAAARRALPLRVSLTRDGDTVTLRVENTTGIPGALLIGPSSTLQVAAALDTTRTAAPALNPVYVDVPKLPRAKNERVWAVLRVSGELRFAGGRRVPLDFMLDDGTPRVVRVPHAAGAPKVRLLAEPAAPVKLLTPPGGSKTWVEAVRRSRVDPARLLELASRARLAVARSLDYATFLVNPDPRGVSRAVYVYETTVRPAPVAAPSQRHDGGSGWTTVATAAILLVGAGGLVVLWAHN